MVWSHIKINLSVKKCVKRLTRIANAVHQWQANGDLGIVEYDNVGPTFGLNKG